MRYGRGRWSGDRQAFWRLLAALALWLGIPAIAYAVESDSTRAVLERHGQLGTWAADCSRPASPDNMYSVYRILDERRVQFDLMDGPTQRRQVGVVEAATELGPQDVQITRVWQSKEREVRGTMIFHIEGNRRRAMEWIESGQTHIAGGRYTKNAGAMSGKETGWVYRCQ